MTAVADAAPVCVLRRVGIALVVSALVATTILSLAGGASASTQSASSYSSRLAQLINSARASHGLKPLTVVSGTTAVAASWTSHMAQTRSLAHNPRLLSDLQHHGSADMNIGAENVGCGAPNDPDGLFQAYMNSPHHRENILNSRMRYLGIAVAFGGQYAWNTMDFVDVYGNQRATQAHSAPTRTHAKPRATSTHRPAARQSVSHAPAQPVAHPARHSTAKKNRAAPARQTAASRPVMTWQESISPAEDVASFAGVQVAASELSRDKTAGQTGLAVVALGGALLVGLLTAHSVVRHRLLP